MNLQKLTLVSTWEDTTKTVSLSYQHRKPECGWQYKITTCTLLFPGDSGIFEEVIYFGLTLPRKIPVRTFLPFLAVDCAVFEQQGVQHCCLCLCFLPHLHGDVIPGGQALADSGERGLLNVPDAFVDPIDGEITFSLPWGLVPARQRP